MQKKSENSIYSQLLIDYLSGSLGSGTQDEEFRKQICRVIFVGNSLCREDESILRDQSLRETRKKKSILTESLELFDGLIEYLLTYIPVSVDVMPGENDPAIFALPQKPLPAFFFPRSRKFSPRFQRVTNPYQFELENFRFLGHSGQILDTLSKFVKYTDKIDLCKQSLEWRHLAPIAPDSIGCVSSETDPFIIEKCPNVFFVGNQPTFETRDIDGENGQRVKIILVPDFSKGSEIAVLNLSNMECYPIKFTSY